MSLRMKLVVGSPLHGAVVQIARNAHNRWREGYLAKKGDKPNSKPTKDEAWVGRMQEAQSPLLTFAAEGGTAFADINTEFENLPSDWGIEGENGIAALETVAIALAAQCSGRDLSDGTAGMEWAAALVNEAWLTRRVDEGKLKRLADGSYEIVNPDDVAWLSPLIVGYARLSKEDKDKDRDWVREAVAALNAV